MIFINLLPNIKLDFVRAQRVRRLLVLLSVVIVLCCFVISSFLFFVVEIQQPATIAQIEGVCLESQKVTPSATEQDGTDAGNEGDGQDDQAASGNSTVSSCGADSDSNLGILAEIRSNEEGNTILTIQNQLQTLPNLHQLKTRPDRLFRESGRSNDIAYLPLMVPKERGTIKTAEFNFETHKFTITGYSKDTLNALSVHATIRFVGYKECLDSQNESNRNSRIYPFRINDEPITGDIGTDQDVVIFNIEGVFSKQLFDRKISDEDLITLGEVPQDAVDPAKLQEADHPCKLPSGEENIDNTKFKELPEWWKES